MHHLQFRFTRPQSSGYELASQNDFADDDDEDDFEVTSAVAIPTLRYGHSQYKG